MVLYSVGLCTLALCLWRLRVVRTLAVSLGGAAAAFGLGAAGIANLVEDGLGLKPVGLIYLAGILLGTFALIPLGAGLARSKRPPWIAAAALLTFPGLILVSEWYGALILAGTWVAAGLLHLAGAFPLVRDGVPVSDRRVVAESV
ncbi:MAG: hypothetical protein M3Q61_03045 [Chloroflexota bacterium]|nr:hypothetical protein [Chloroflexota bacterium]